MEFFILDDEGFRRELEFLGISKAETGKLQHEELRELQVIWRKYPEKLRELQEEMREHQREEWKELQGKYSDFQGKLSQLQEKYRVYKERLREPRQKQGNNIRPSNSTDKLIESHQQQSETEKYEEAKYKASINEQEKEHFSNECFIQVTNKVSRESRQRNMEIKEKIKKQGNKHTSIIVMLIGKQNKDQGSLGETGMRGMQFEEKLQKQGNNLDSSTTMPTGPERKIKDREHRNSVQKIQEQEFQRRITGLEQKNVELQQNNAVFKEEIKHLANTLSSTTDQLTVYQRRIQKLEQRNKELEEKAQKQECKYECELEVKVPKNTTQKFIGSGRKIKDRERKDSVQKIQEQDAIELDRYEIGEGRRGICLVINNVKFLGEDERRGGEIDEKKIAALFSEELHFKVKIKRNLGGLEILKTAQEIAAKDHSKYSAFVFIIMSHGEKRDVIQGVDGRKAGVEDLMSEFTATNCPTLQNKPKLFFIQACRGQGSDPRMNRLAQANKIEGDSVAIMNSPDSTLANGVSPREADFLLAFATVPGYKAWRSKIEGSWFIQVLVDVIQMHHRHHHLLDMLTEVNKQVADIANEYPQVDLSFQVPAPTHTLRAQVFI